MTQNPLYRARHYADLILWAIANVHPARLNSATLPGEDSECWNASSLRYNATRAAHFANIALGS